MQFSDYKYTRPDIKKEKDKRELLAKKILECKTKDEFLKYLHEKENDTYFETMASLCSVRNTIDMNDKFYKEEQAFFDEEGPNLDASEILLLKAITVSPFRKDAEKEIGTYLFKKYDLELLTKDEKLVDLLIKENQKMLEYRELIASAKINFKGEVYNLPQMQKFTEDENRETRKEAKEKIAEFFLNNQDHFDEIYDSLVKLRTEEAKVKGYENFVELGYNLLGRTDYNKDDVKKYREEIKKYVVPVMLKIRKKQAERVKIKDFKYYDKPLFYLDGNPTPKGDREKLVSLAKEMYHDLSKETDEFFTFMTDRKLMDLDSKPGKTSGGYCTYFPDFKSPFIFANFNKTSHDVTVLTHEAGHAFQVYSSRNIPFSSLTWPTLEACEIHSMSMEYITWPFMEKFFKEDTNKFFYAHLAEDICFLPYGALIDEFQHLVYENPDLSPIERRQAFRKLEKEYLPFLDYDDQKFFENGGMWFVQGHVFTSPFYYIDYTLAEVCAFQFFLESRSNKKRAWERYLKLCKLGGQYPFTKLLELVGLANPFTSGFLENMMKKLTPVLGELEKNLKQ